MFETTESRSKRSAGSLPVEILCNHSLGAARLALRQQTLDRTRVPLVCGFIGNKLEKAHVRGKLGS